MGPLRILIVAGLIYLGYRLIRNNMRKSDQVADGKSGQGREAEQITDVLVEDPVCHKLVPKQQAITIEVAGEKHYFCSTQCSELFLADEGDES